MFWLNDLISHVEARFAERIKEGSPLIVREEKTASGRVHIGSLRAASIHGIVAEKLNEKGIKAKFIFEINDFDPMDGCPKEFEKDFLQHMGKPLCNVPSPDGKAKNFAEYFAEEYKAIIEKVGFSPEFYRISDVYKAGKFDEIIRTVLENADKIRGLYQKISKSEKPADWHPLQVICPNCGKVGTTRVYDFDGKEVSFVCEKSMVSWAEGCGNSGKVSPFGGNGKLPWKVEWPAKWKVMGVDIEGAGKDHYTKGGSRDLGKAIAEQILDYPMPFDIPHEFILVGGAKMSSSKGKGASAKDISELLPSEIVRELLLRKAPRKIINFEPEGDTVPTLFDEYDKLEKAYFEKNEQFKEVFEAFYPAKKLEKLKPVFRPRFRDLSFMVQVPHINLDEKLTEIKGSPLNEDDKKALEVRIIYIKKWLASYAPEKYIFSVSENLPAGVSLDTNEKKVISEILEFMKKSEEISGNDLHGFFHSLKETLELSPREIFVPIYKIFLSREDGPKAGFLLSVLDKDFVMGRCEESLR